ncbi:bZIP transcription factor [Histoplasma capsulatum G186AR]|uniref:BZIP transcription factor n=1 Tax=Ajellomyces capsulatus TaxID=5037 RepID=A0A8H8D3D4_AJECA|nr:bZIP transcription factor [Histoplasma capsulatum]QSS67184.1 bZIP transcription factor [Histoplasma capsulatum G186AR]
MSDFDSLYQRSLYLSPDQQDLLLAALASGDKTAKMANGQSQPNPPSEAQFPDSRPNSSSPQVNSFDNTGISNRDIFESPPDEPLDIAQLGFEGSPFLGFDLDVDFDPREDLIGDLPGPSPNGDDIEQGEKRKSIDGNEEAEGGKKRRETDDKMAKKPGRKPLTSEPTTKRKAQNRAAQRAFRERKEKHLKDLETKVEELEKISQSTNTENKLLRAQVERLQGEVKEYRKRLPWVNGGTSLLPTTSSRMRGSEYRDNSLLNGNDFSFQFPKFGDLPGSHMFGDGLPKAPSHQAKRGSASPTILGYDYRTPATSVNSFKSANVASQPQNFNLGNTPQFVRTPDSMHSADTAKSQRRNTTGIENINGSFDNYPGRPSRNNTGLSYTSTRSGTNSNNYATYQIQNYGSSNASNSASPSASSESQHLSSIGTSPEPSVSSPSIGKLAESGLNTINEQNGNHPEGEDHNNHNNNTNNSSNNNINFPGDGLLGIDWLAQQNGGQFDPVLFGDYRDPQDAVLSQDFGNFFNDALPFPEFGGSLDSLNELSNGNATTTLSSTTPQKHDLLKQIDNVVEGKDDEEVVPAEDPSQMLSCTKIWDRLQSMEKFRNGEIDVDSLCSELRTKARCSEGGVVVKQDDVEAIISRAE